MIHNLPEIFAFALIGLIVGEFLHRLSLYLAKGDLRGVFSNRHQQHWKCPCLLLLAFLIIVSQEQSPGLQQIFLRIIPVTVVWALIRVSGAMDNSVEDETIFRENHAELGPGLAANYYHGFLQVLLHAELEGRAQVEYDYINTIEAKMSEFCQDIHFEGAWHHKMFIILPKNCKFYDDHTLLENEERMFKFNQELDFTLRGMDPKSMSLYWIYEDQHREEEVFHVKDVAERRKKMAEMDEKVKKILFIWDFPSIIMRAMGPGSCFTSSHCRGNREKNIRSFKATIELLSGPASVAIEFLQIERRSRRSEPLSTLIRNRIMIRDEM